jgi:TfoX/Sxy family transcriptional regulator of competence genes
MGGLRGLMQARTGATVASAPKWRNWQTRRTQNPVGREARVGSTPTFGTMAYDEQLADRIRELLAGERGLREQKMFGGLGFLVDGNMAVAASGQGGLLVRVDPEESDTLVRKTAAYPMEMRGRQMAGWLRVDADAVRTKKQLSLWVDRGVTFARSLPAKR